jgi:hypothetical protein
VNFGEKPDIFPTPTDLRNSVITNKLDGSLLIVSRYKGQYILRTRGTVDATKFENGFELEVFKNLYLNILNDSCYNADTWETSFLFEWLTAVAGKEIVLKYENVPNWILVGAVNHGDYSLFPQDVLDVYAKMHGFNRPEHFTFNTIDELLKEVSEWKGREGIVLYTKEGQMLHKIKSDFYKKLHAFKSEASLENTVEIFLTFGCPEFVDFQQKIGELYDWECVQMVIGHMSNICDAYKDVKRIIQGMNVFVNDVLKPLPTRKDQAVKVLSAYGSSGRNSMVFTILDGKVLGNEQVKKLLYQCLKK